MIRRGERCGSKRLRGDWSRDVRATSYDGRRTSYDGRRTSYDSRRTSHLVVVSSSAVLNGISNAVNCASLVTSQRCLAMLFVAR